MSRDATVLISGAGPAGLAAAVLLAQEKVSVIVVAPPTVDDPRTTALMLPAMNLLRFVNLWPGDLKEFSAPLKRLHIIDDTGNMVSAPAVEFAATELGHEEFGWNVPVARLVQALRQRALDLGVQFVVGTSKRATSDDADITLLLEDGLKLSSQILLAADGAKSALRTSLGISVDTEQFEQTAIATSFEHSAAHEYVSTEWHKASGPFTTVPLPGNRSSLVWMERPKRAAELLAMPDRELAQEIQLESHGSLGKVSRLGPRKAFPMQSQRATSFSAKRAILLGEAAHALPPIGAQGLNLSLRDAAQAADLIIGAHDAGNEQVTSEYNRLRRADVVPRQQITALMNRSLLSDLLPLQLGRVAGMAAIGKIPFLRNLAMQQGLQPAANLPFAMRG